MIGGLAGTTLIRLAPGFGLEEQVMDPRRSAESVRAIERRHEGERNPLVFYVRFWFGLMRGDAGESTVYRQPVRRLISERADTTVRSVLLGLTLGWCAALVVASTGALSGRGAAILAGTALSGVLLSIPSALLAAVCLLLRLSPGTAIAAVVFPRIFPHAYEQLRRSLAAPHVIMAHARGLSATRVFLRYAAPAAGLPLLALAGVSVTLAFGASIPIEAFADSPGIGQLAWRAALGRDLPVLVPITLLLTGTTVIVNTFVDLAVERLGRHAS
jgi:peptide/nickel transport system permease protein